MNKIEEETTEMECEMIFAKIRTINPVFRSIVIDIDRQINWLFDTYQNHLWHMLSLLLMHRRYAGGFIEFGAFEV